MVAFHAAAKHHSLIRLVDLQLNKTSTVASLWEVCTDNCEIPLSNQTLGFRFF